MILLWILGIAALLLFLLGRMRVRILASMRESELSLYLRIGLVRARLYPPPEKPEKKKREKKKKKKPEEEAEPSQGLPVPTLEDVRDALRSLPGPLRRALGRIGRSLRIHPLTVSVVFGGWEDPPAAAENYGTASAVVWTFMPLLERWLNIPDPDIRFDVDFTAPETAIEGEVGVDTRVGTLLGAGLGVGVPALRWFRRAAGRRRDSEKEKEKGRKDKIATENQGNDKGETENQGNDKGETENQGNDKGETENQGNEKEEKQGKEKSGKRKKREKKRKDRKSNDAA